MTDNMVNSLYKQYELHCSEVSENKENADNHGIHLECSEIYDWTRS